MDLFLALILQLGTKLYVMIIFCMSQERGLPHLCQKQEVIAYSRKHCSESYFVLYMFPHSQCLS